jgi:hypothetical protein
VSPQAEIRTELSGAPKGISYMLDFVAGVLLGGRSGNWHIIVPVESYKNGSKMLGDDRCASHGETSLDKNQVASQQRYRCLEKIVGHAASRVLAH